MHALSQVRHTFCNRPYEGIMWSTAHWWAYGLVDGDGGDLFGEIVCMESLLFLDADRSALGIDLDLCTRIRWRSAQLHIHSKMKKTHLPTCGETIL